MTAPDFYFSDPHFGHARIIEFCARPFRSVEEMDRELIARYQAVVQPHHTVLWLGDCFFTSPYNASQILAQLPGHKLLCLGNHDRSASAMARCGFTAVTTALTMHLAGQTVRAQHHLTPMPQDAWLMHGHVHSTVRREGRRLHVGVDAWDYRPAALSEIEALISVDGEGAPAKL